MIRIITIPLLVLLSYASLGQTIISIDTIDVVDTFFTNTQSVSKGQVRVERRSDGSVWRNNIGEWKTWYKEGQIHSEMLYYDSSGYHMRYFRNFWLPDGRQIAKDGEGHHARIEASEFEVFVDSFVYTLKNGKLFGKYERFRRYPKEQYKVVETGSLDFYSDRTGKWQFKDDKNQYYYRAYFSKGRLQGPLQQYYSSGNLRLEGYNNRYFEDSSLIMYNEQGISIVKVLRDTSHPSPSRYKYYEFHSNGKMKLEGFYNDNFFDIPENDISGLEFDPKSKLNIFSEGNDTIEAIKVGVWKFYDSNGRQVKSEKYEWGQLVE